MNDGRPYGVEMKVHGVPDDYDPFAVSLNHGSREFVDFTKLPLKFLEAICQAEFDNPRTPCWLNEHDFGREISYVELMALRPFIQGYLESNPQSHPGGVEMNDVYSKLLSEFRGMNQTYKNTKTMRDIHMENEKRFLSLPDPDNK
jgi:hypothetical protein